MSFDHIYAGYMTRVLSSFTTNIANKNKIVKEKIQKNLKLYKKMIKKII